MIMAVRACIFAAMAVLMGAMTSIADSRVEYSTAEVPGINADTGDASSISDGNSAGAEPPVVIPTAASDVEYSPGAVLGSDADAGAAGGGARSAGDARPGSASAALSVAVIQMGKAISAIIHRTGGYRFDGYNDCYGFVRRTWNPILSGLRRRQVKGAYPAVLPRGDYPSRAWRPIRSWNELVPGDVLGTVQGHRGGGDVDYGMYGGKKNGVHYQFSNGGGAGPVFKPQSGRYRYYYGPTHELLTR